MEWDSYGVASGATVQRGASCAGVHKDWAAILISEPISSNPELICCTLAIGSCTLCCTVRSKDADCCLF